MNQHQFPTLPNSCFKCINIPKKTASITLKSFLESKNLTISPSNCYYEFTNPKDSISLDRRFIVQSPSGSKDFLIGSYEVSQQILGVQQTQEETKTRGFVVDDSKFQHHKIFVQAVALNRKLKGGTSLLFIKDTVPDPSEQVEVPTTNSPQKRSAPTQIPACGTPSKKSKATSSSTVELPNILRPTQASVEIVISFDTTASMFPCLSTVRGEVKQLLQKLTSGIPLIRLGLIAQGDYDSPPHNGKYATRSANNFKFCDATKLDELINFTLSAEECPNYSVPECYELVLHETATKFDWTPGTQKALVLIGDSCPHLVTGNPGGLDWRVEANKLKEMGVRVYAVQALARGTDSFYRELGSITNGFHLRLDQFSSVGDFLTAVCYHEGDRAGLSTELLNALESEVAQAGKMVRNLRQLFDQLSGKAPAVPSSTVDYTNTVSSTTGLIPISPSRFQVLTIDKDTPIKQFAEDRGLRFKVGRGFYEFTKPEAISNQKEIVLWEKTTGDFYNGWEAARKLSGIEPGLKSKQKPKENTDFVVFVQSTSYNRKLIAGQRFLYEVE